MTADEVLELARIRLDDVKTPYLWSDDFLAGALDRAFVEAIERSSPIYDQGTEEVCVIPLVIGTHTYEVHPSIQQIDRLFCASDDRALVPRSMRDVANDAGLQWDQHQGLPYWYYRLGRSIRVYPTPTVTDTLNLWVYRRPLDAELPSKDSTMAALGSQYHDKLVEWVCYEAYRVKDSDTYAMDKAAEALKLFEAAFGRRRSAKADRVLAESPGNPTVYPRLFGF